MVKINKTKLVKRAYAESRYSGSLELTYSEKSVKVKKTDKTPKANFKKILPIFASVVYALPAKAIKNSVEVTFKLLPSNGFTISGQTPEYFFYISSLVKKELLTLPPADVTYIPDEFAFFVKMFGLSNHDGTFTNGVIKLIIKKND